MYKLYAFWSAPAERDQASFEEYYQSKHIPRAAAVPGLQVITTTLTSDGLEGGQPAHYRIAEMSFADKAAFQASTQSPEWAEMRSCSGDIIARYNVTLTVEMGDEVKGTPSQGVPSINGGQ